MPSTLQIDFNFDVPLSIPNIDSRQLQFPKLHFFICKRYRVSRLPLGLLTLWFPTGDRLPCTLSVSSRFQDAIYVASQTWTRSTYMVLPLQIWPPWSTTMISMVIVILSQVHVYLLLHFIAFDPVLRSFIFPIVLMTGSNVFLTCGMCFGVQRSPFLRISMSFTGAMHITHSFDTANLCFTYDRSLPSGISQ